MIDDPVVEEIRRIKREFAARFNYDVHAIGEELRRLERENNRVVTTPAKTEGSPPGHSSDRSPTN